MFGFTNLNDSELENLFYTYRRGRLGLDGCPDDTLEYTLKALLGERVLGSICMSVGLKVPMDTRRFLNEDIPRKIVNYDGYDLFMLYVDNSDRDEYPRVSNCAGSYLIAKGFVENEAAHIFMAQHNCEARFFINNTAERTVAILDKFDAKTYHLVQALIPVMLPWCFEDKPVTDKEKELLSSLMVTSADSYRAWMCEYIRSLDLRADSIRNKLKGYTSRFVTTQIKSLEKTLVDYENQIRNYETQITNLFRQRTAISDQLSGLYLRDKGDDEDSSLIDFLVATKAIRLANVYENDIYIEVKTTLDNFDPDVYERYAKNPHSPFNIPSNYGDYGLADGKLLMDAIFGEQKLKVNMRASFDLNFGNGMHAIRTDYTSFTRDCLDNPHLTAFKCLGNNGPRLAQYMRERNYVMALSLCIAIAGNLNLSEVPNVNNFMEYLFLRNRDRKFIKLPDGTDVTVAEAISFLKKE